MTDSKRFFDEDDNVKRRVSINFDGPQLLEDVDGDPLGIDPGTETEYEYDPETGAYSAWISEEPDCD